MSTLSIVQLQHYVDKVKPLPLSESAQCQSQWTEDYWRWNQSGPAEEAEDKCKEERASNQNKNERYRQKIFKDLSAQFPLQDYGWES